MKHILEILQQKIHKLIDLIDVPLMLLGSYTIGQWKDFAGLVGIIVTVSYTVWKWTKELKESKIKS